MVAYFAEVNAHFANIYTRSPQVSTGGQRVAGVFAMSLFHLRGQHRFLR